MTLAIFGIGHYRGICVSQTHLVFYEIQMTTTHLSSYLMQKIVSNIREFIIHNLDTLANIVDNGCMLKKSDIHFIIRKSQVNGRVFKCQAI